LTLVVLAWSIYAFGVGLVGTSLPRVLVYLFLAAGLGYAFRWALVGRGCPSYRNQEIPNGAIILLITVGIADFVSAFFSGMQAEGRSTAGR